MSKQALFQKRLDMTTGEPYKLILRFSVPLLLGNLLQQMYNTVDSMVVGKLVGSTALAAVGVSGSVMHLILSFFLGLAAGTSVVVSQAFGAKDLIRQERIAHSLLLATVLVSLLSMTIGISLTEPILHLMDTPNDVISDAKVYMMIMFSGVVCTMLYNIITGLLQGMGDSTSPFLILLVCSSLNVALDLFCVAVLKMGVAGVAWATILSQLVSVIVGLHRIHHGHIHLRRSALRIDWHEIVPIMKIGIPTGVQNMLSSVGNILVQGVMNGFGYVVMAANVAVIKIDSFCTMPMTTFSTAVTVYVGQNTGAGRDGRIAKGIRSALKLSIGISLIISAFLFFFGEWPLRLFTDEDAVIQVGMDKFHIVCAFYWCMAVFGILSGAMRGKGYSVIPMLIGISTMFIGRIPVAYLLSRRIGANGIFWSLSVQWALEAVVAVLCYFALGAHKKPILDKASTI